MVIGRIFIKTNAILGNPMFPMSPIISDNDNDVVLPLCTIRLEQICHHCQGFVLWFLKFISLLSYRFMFYSLVSVLALLCWKFWFTRPVLHLSSLSSPTVNATPRLLSHITSRVIIYIDCVTRSPSPSPDLMPLWCAINGASALCHPSSIHTESLKSALHSSLTCWRQEAAMMRITYSRVQIDGPVPS